MKNVPDQVVVACTINNVRRHYTISGQCWLGDLRNHLTYFAGVPVETPVREIEILVNPHLEDWDKILNP